MTPQLSKTNDNIGITFTPKEQAGLAKLSPAQNRLLLKVIGAAIRILEYAEQNRLFGFDHIKLLRAKGAGLETIIKTANLLVADLNRTGTPAEVIIKGFFDSGDIHPAVYGEAKSSPILAADLALTLMNQ